MTASGFATLAATALLLTPPMAQAATFGTGADRATIADQIFGLPGSSCSGAGTAQVNALNLPVVPVTTGLATPYTLEGGPSGRTRRGFFADHCIAGPVSQKAQAAN
jgi:hypothetical protein